MNCSHHLGLLTKASDIENLINKTFNQDLLSKLTSTIKALVKRCCRLFIQFRETQILNKLASINYIAGEIVNFLLFINLICIANQALLHIVAELLNIGYSVPKLNHHACIKLPQLDENDRINLNLSFESDIASDDSCNCTFLQLMVENWHKLLDSSIDLGSTLMPMLNSKRFKIYFGFAYLSRYIEIFNNKSSNFQILSVQILSLDDLGEIFAKSSSFILSFFEQIKLKCKELLSSPSELGNLIQIMTCDLFYMSKPRTMALISSNFDIYSAYIEIIAIFQNSNPLKLSKAFVKEGFIEANLRNEAMLLENFINFSSFIEPDCTEMIVRVLALLLEKRHDVRLDDPQIFSFHICLERAFSSVFTRKVIYVHHKTGALLQDIIRELNNQVYACLSESCRNYYLNGPDSLAHDLILSVMRTIGFVNSTQTKHWVTYGESMIYIYHIYYKIRDYSLFFNADYSLIKLLALSFNFNYQDENRDQIPMNSIDPSILRISPWNMLMMMDINSSYSNYLFSLLERFSFSEIDQKDNNLLIRNLETLNFILLHDTYLFDIRFSSLISKLKLTDKVFIEVTKKMSTDTMYEYLKFFITHYLAGISQPVTFSAIVKQLPRWFNCNSADLEHTQIESILDEVAKKISNPDKPTKFNLKQNQLLKVESSYLVDVFQKSNYERLVLDYNKGIKSDNQPKMSSVSSTLAFCIYPEFRNFGVKFLISKTNFLFLYTTILSSSLSQLTFKEKYDCTLFVSLIKLFNSIHAVYSSMSLEINQELNLKIASIIKSAIKVAGNNENFQIDMIESLKAFKLSEPENDCEAACKLGSIELNKKVFNKFKSKISKFKSTIKNENIPVDVVENSDSNLMIQTGFCVICLSEDPSKGQICKFGYLIKNTVQYCNSERQQIVPQIVGCGHKIHFECWSSAFMSFMIQLEKRIIFNCPLCKKATDITIPLLNHELIDKAFSHFSINDILASKFTAKPPEVMETLSLTYIDKVLGKSFRSKMLNGDKMHKYFIDLSNYLYSIVDSHLNFPSIDFGSEVLIKDLIYNIKLMVWTEKLSLLDISDFFKNVVSIDFKRFYFDAKTPIQVIYDSIFIAIILFSKDQLISIFNFILMNSLHLVLVSFILTQDEPCRIINENSELLDSTQVLKSVTDMESSFKKFIQEMLLNRIYTIGKLLLGTVPSIPIADQVIDLMKENDVLSLVQFISKINPGLDINLYLNAVIKNKNTQSAAIRTYSNLPSNNNFKLIELPANIRLLHEAYSNTKCPNCNRVPQLSVLCLLCGKKLCYVFECCNTFVKRKYEVLDHAHSCGRDNTILLHIEDGRISYMINGMLCKTSIYLYVNRYNECFYLQGIGSEFRLNSQTLDSITQNFIAAKHHSFITKSTDSFFLVPELDNESEEEF